MNNLSNNKLILLSVLAILLSFVSIMFSYNIGKNSLSNQNNLSWNVIQGKGGEVDIYLKGSLASKVIGADLNAFFDTSHVDSISVEAGGFFNDPIIIKLDNKDLSYSLIQNPENKIGNDPSKPMFKFRLSSPGSLTGYSFYTLPGSQVYLNNMGGVYPSTSRIVLK